ncbi:MAG TPA: nitrilase-related carbon-nitrogen hydrolase, partial [Ramlibacter sp.]
MKIAALQTVSGASLDANLESARALLAKAANQGAELAVLPEYFCLMGQRDRDKLAVREAFGSGRVQSFLAQQARDLRMWIVGGTLPLVAESDAHVRNSSLAFSPGGECVARYDKIHLFRYDNGREQYDEARVIEGGRTPASF